MTKVLIWRIRNPLQNGRQPPLEPGHSGLASDSNSPDAYVGESFSVTLTVNNNALNGRDLKVETKSDAEQQLMFDPDRRG
jgi:hypothetical protein